MTLPKLKAKALDLFAKVVKLRAYRNDKLFCYTCGKPLQLNTVDCQCGHYLSRGAYSGLTFHPNNSRPQCRKCNYFLNGNLIEYRIRLIAELGEKAVLDLESRRHEPLKLSRSDYEKMIEMFKEEINELC
jgi:hypothetical protein